MGFLAISPNTKAFKPNDSLLYLFSFSPVGVSSVKVQMPALSPTMEEGNIVKWLKKEGTHGEKKLLPGAFFS